MLVDSTKPTIPTAATTHKRQQLCNFVDRFLKPDPAIRAVVGVGSIAFGTVRPDSDIDAVLFMDPVDHYIVPPESRWVPESNTFHSIFSNDPAGIYDIPYYQFYFRKKYSLVRFLYDLVGSAYGNRQYTGPRKKRDKAYTFFPFPYYSIN